MPGLPHKQRLALAVANEVLVELAVLVPAHYRNSSAALGITELFETANTFAWRHPEPQTLVRISWWGQSPDKRFECVWDSHPLLPYEPKYLIVAPSSVGCHSSWASSPMHEAKAWIRDIHERGALVGTVYDGVFLLAETGLLDGVTVNVHAEMLEAFSERFPSLATSTAEEIVDHQDIIISCSPIGWIDVGLLFLRKIFGPRLMLDVSEFLMIEPPRSLSIFMPIYNHGDATILKVQNWLRLTGAKNADVAELAEMANLGRRTFLRRFVKATGLRPTEYCQRLRIERACELMHISKRNIGDIAWEIGYNDVGSFNRVFTRIVGLSPSKYNTNARGGDSRLLRRRSN